MSSKPQPYQITHVDYTDEDMADDISEHFQITLTAEDIYTCGNLGNLHARIVTLYKSDETEQGKCATQMAFYRLRTLLPDGDNLDPSTSLKSIKGLHYARLRRQMRKEFGLDLLPYRPLERLYTDRHYWVKINVAISIYVGLLMLAGWETGPAVSGFALLAGLYYLWRRKSPPYNVTHLGQLAQMTAGLNIQTLRSQGASVTSALVWHGLRALYTSGHSEDWHKLTPQTRLT